MVGKQKNQNSCLYSFSTLATKRFSPYKRGTGFVWCSQAPRHILNLFESSMKSAFALFFGGPTRIRTSVNRFVETIILPLNYRPK